MSMQQYRTIVVSFSGGRTSAFMAKYLWERYGDTHRIICVFANTGKEREETLVFVKKCSDEWGLDVVWIEADIREAKGEGTRSRRVSFHTADRNGFPFQAMIEKYGIPNQSMPHCSRELKQTPLHDYVRWASKVSNWGEYCWAIGIRADERHRIPKNPPTNFIYPLADEIIVDKEFIRRWWSNQSFDLGLDDHEGNCDLCWKKSITKLKTIIKTNPDSIEWWKRMEADFGDRGAMASKSGESQVFFRGKISAKELQDMAQEGQFTPYSDPVRFRSGFQRTLFEDQEQDCFCKAT